jgi:hypothetical protein
MNRVDVRYVFSIFRLKDLQLMLLWNNILLMVHMKQGTFYFYLVLKLVKASNRLSLILPKIFILEQNKKHQQRLNQ